MLLTNLTKASCIFVVTGLTILLTSNHPTMMVTCADVEAQQQRQYKPRQFHVSSSSSFMLRRRMGEDEDLDPRIINGNEVDDPGRFPYYVALTDSNMRHICGGSLIAPGEQSSCFIRCQRKRALLL
jgi:hypothetical protein